MRRQKVGLILNVIILLCWSFVGISRAITAPSWLLMLDGGIMMAYLLMTIDDIFALVRAAKAKREAATAQESTTEDSSREE